MLGVRAPASVKAVTIFPHTKVPLTKWFLAIYLLAQSKNDISAMELMRQLGVKYDTADRVNQEAASPLAGFAAQLVRDDQ